MKGMKWKLSFGWTPVLFILSLLALALAYWGRWIAHPVAGLNILGVDLPEYVKFVPEVRYGVIPLNRLIFFITPTSLTLGLILLASLQARFPLGLRILAGVLAVPVALSMLPPAWTPGVLMTPEFRFQTLLIMALIMAAFLIPLWQRLLPDWARGLLWVILALANIIPWRGFMSIIPALETLYHHPLHPGPGVVWLGISMVMMLITGGLLMAGKGLVEPEHA